MGDVERDACGEGEGGWFWELKIQNESRLVF